MSILCATDLSDHAGEAADVAVELAAKLNLPLCLLHCAPEWMVSRDFDVIPADDRILQAELEAEAERLRQAGVTVTTKLEHGIPSLVILEAAKALSPSFLVAGSTGAGLAGQWLIGSVAERVAEASTVPTLIVREAGPLLKWLRGEAPLRLLYGVDFSASAETAIAVTKPLIAIGSVEVEATSVRTKTNPDFAKDPATRQRDVWELLTERLGDVPVKVHVRDQVTTPHAQFLETADDANPGLLVVGTHHDGNWKKFRKPSFSRHILTYAVTNVLCVPAGAATVPSIPHLRRVLLATDFSAACLEAYRYAHSLLPGGGSIHIVHVCPEPSRGINPLVASSVFFDHALILAKAKAGADEKLKALPAALRKLPDVAVTTEVLVHDHPAEAICETAERIGADVICLGTKGHSRAGAAVLGSTVQAVLAKSHIPVLAVTPPAP